jgi:hypothetical protein
MHATFAKRKKSSKMKHWQIFIYSFKRRCSMFHKSPLDYGILWTMVISFLNTSRAKVWRNCGFFVFVSKTQISFCLGNELAPMNKSMDLAPKVLCYNHIVIINIWPTLLVATHHLTIIIISHHVHMDGLKG